METLLFSAWALQNFLSSCAAPKVGVMFTHKTTVTAISNQDIYGCNVKPKPFTSQSSVPFASIKNSPHTIFICEPIKTIQISQYCSSTFWKQISSSNYDKITWVHHHLTAKLTATSGFPHAFSNSGCLCQVWYLHPLHCN